MRAFLVQGTSQMWISLGVGYAGCSNYYYLYITAVVVVYWQAAALLFIGSWAMRALEFRSWA